MELELKQIPSTSETNQSSNDISSTDISTEQTGSVTQETVTAQHLDKIEAEEEILKHKGILHAFLFVSRGLVLFALYFLCCMSVLYTIGSLVKLKADNLFCPLHTEEQVRLHNFENGLSGGDPDSCFYINRQKLNVNDIKNLNLEIFTASIEINNVYTFQFATYILLLFLIVIVLLYHTYLFTFDLICVVCLHNKINHHRNTNMLKQIKNNQIKSIAAIAGGKNSKLAPKNCASCQRLRLWKKQYLYPDSKWYLFAQAGKELVEITIQFYALMLYGGLNIFDSKQNILAQESHIISSMFHMQRVKNKKSLTKRLASTQTLL